MTILENKEFMANNINSIGRDHLDKYMEIKTKICLLEDIVNLFEMKIEKLIDVAFEDYTVKIIRDVTEHLKEDGESFFIDKEWSSQIFLDSVKKNETTSDIYYTHNDIMVMIGKYEKQIDEIDITKIKMHRIYKLLAVAEVPGKDEKKKIY